MIILQKKTEKKNQYKRIADDILLNTPITSKFLLGLEQWKTIKPNLKKKRLKIGIEIFSDDDLNLISNDLNYFAMIQINFKSFKDGRPFSLVKNLRGKFQFNGEVRAAGHILPDQFVFLIRCGFDTVEIHSKDKDIWIELLNMDTGLYYQP